MELGSSAPVPGGGSAAALAGALGTELLLMTCRLPKSRSNDEAEKAALQKAALRLEALAAALRDAVDADAESFDAVMKAMRLPRENDEQKRVRSAEIQRAYQEATRVPLAVGAGAAEALSIASAIVSSVNPNALSDAGSGAALLAATVDGATYNVQINLQAVKDEAFVEAHREELAGVRDGARESLQSVRAFLERDGLKLL